MDRRRFTQILVLAFAVSLAVRIHNALTYPSLRAFDGFGHFTYIWFMAENWRVPPPTSGWSFFHPPLYYWIMASIWTFFEQVDPVRRLSIGTSLTATLGLTQAVVTLLITRRYFPAKPVVQLLATGLMLFLPVHLFTAGYLGNESLNAVMCSLTALATLWVLRKPGWKRGLVLGLCLGGAMLTKFTAFAFVAGSLMSIGLATLWRRTWIAGTATLVAAVTVLTAMSGWFYARNILEYGDPFKVSRDEFLVRRHENLQTVGKRDLLEYVLFDPLIVYRPQWPRGVPISGDMPAGATHSSLRESVWTGVFANAFFDGVGAQVLPLITHSEESRRAGQLLLGLGLLPTALVLVGLFTAAWSLVRRGWDDTLGPMLVMFVCMVLIFVQATRTVPMNAAVKATYLTPASVLFAFWFALGLDRLLSWRPRLAKPVVAWMSVLALASVTVFTIGRFVARGWLDEAVTFSPVWKSLYGVVYYAAGDRERAREGFEAGARINLHLSLENLAAMALEDGRLLEALYFLRSAAKFQQQQLYGIPEDRVTYTRITQAEYANTMAVIYHRLGWREQALASAKRAYELDPTIPDAGYDLALLSLSEAVRRGDEAEIRRAAGESLRMLERVVADDPGFFDAKALAGAAKAFAGECDEGVREMRAALDPPPGQYRFYPSGTGQGDIQAAAIRRRVHIPFGDRLLSPLTEPCSENRGQAPFAS